MDPDPDPRKEIEVDPDPDPAKCSGSGSGSETLLDRIIIDKKWTKEVGIETRNPEKIYHKESGKRIS